MKYSLCWYCAKATEDCNHMCQWLHQNKPMKNWNAEKGELQRYRDIEGNLHRGHTYNVISCPHFERDVEWLDYAEFVEEASRALGFNNNSQFYAHPLKNAKLFEEKTGKKVPQWVYEEIEYLASRDCVKKDKPTTAATKKKKHTEIKLTDEDYQELLEGGFDTRWI